MIFGLRSRAPDGEVLFDSSVDQVLMLIEERTISGSGFTSQTFSYPAFAGTKLAAFMLSPYQNGDIDGYQVLSCRVSNSGTPTVTVFVDRTGGSIPICDGLLTVFSTGAPQ